MYGVNKMFEENKLTKEVQKRMFLELLKKMADEQNKELRIEMYNIFEVVMKDI